MSAASAYQRYRRLPAADRRLLREAAVSLALASVAIRLLPFRRLERLLTTSRAQLASRDAVAPGRICRAVEAWGRRVPWRAMCFQQGLAVHWMLRRRGAASRLHYGAAHDGAAGRIAAHVWVSVDGCVVIGGEVADYACLAVYPREPDTADARAGAPG